MAATTTTTTTTASSPCLVAVLLLLACVLPSTVASSSTSASSSIIKILRHGNNAAPAYIFPFAQQPRRKQQPRPQCKDNEEENATSAPLPPKAMVRRFAPFLLSLLPMVAPPPFSPAQQQAAWAAPMAAVSTTMTMLAAETAEDDAARLMGKVEPIEKLPQEAEGIFKRARIAESDNEFDKALRLYDRVTRIAPGYAFAWSNKGNAYIALGELENGLDSYKRAIELLPSKTGDAWLVYLNKATTEMALDQMDNAIRDLDEARNIHGQPDVLLFANKALALERKGQYASAMENYEFAVLTKPKDVQPWWLRYSFVLFQQQQDIKSMEIMRKCAAKFARVDEIKAALATLVFAYGDTNEAERIWGEVTGQGQYKYRDETFLRETLRWPPRLIKTLSEFKGLYTPPRKTVV